MLVCGESIVEKLEDHLWSKELHDQFNSMEELLFFLRDESTIFHFFTFNDRKNIPSVTYSLLSFSLDMGPY